MNFPNITPELLIYLIVAAAVGMILAWLLARWFYTHTHRAETGTLKAALAAAAEDEARLSQEAQEAARRAEHWQGKSEEWQEHYQAAQVQLAALEALNRRLPLLENELENKTAQENHWRETVAQLQTGLAQQEGRLSQMQQLQSEYQRLNDDYAVLQQDYSRLQVTQERLLTQLQQERLAQEEKIALLQEAREGLGLQFKNLANEILEEKAKKFSEHNQSSLNQILTPLHERMQQFGRLVEETHQKDARERITLEVELKKLQELNTRLNHDAIALTQALTGQNNKTQGNWGEMILEKVLENSGLTRGREYIVQAASTHTDEDGRARRLQPDVLVLLPENKQLIIDAKVSLNAYVQYTRAESEEARQAALKAHLNSVRTHLKELSGKRYQDIEGLTSLDYVLMFIPVEPAYLLALQHDESLYQDSFERRIMLVGPSTLLATMRTIAGVWRYQHQNKNAEAIALEGGKLYDKFVGFVNTLESVGKNLAQTQFQYETAMKQLQSGTGNLITRAQKLAKLGVKASKQLDTQKVESAEQWPEQNSLPLDSPESVNSPDLF